LDKEKNEKLASVAGCMLNISESNIFFLLLTVMTPHGMTPRMGVSGQTPLRTPVRDKLNINPEEEFDMNNDKIYQVSSYTNVLEKKKC
jgi:hypothetical protein